MSGFAEFEPQVQRARVPVVIRPATDSDIDDIVRIQQRAGRSVRPDGYRQAVADPDRCVLTATTAAPDGTPVVVGWGQTHHLTAATDLAPVGHYLGGVTVDPSWRRKGVALALTQARIEWIAERAPEAYYVVNARNHASIELHRRWGFVEVARAARLAGTSFDGGVGLLMRTAW